MANVKKWILKSKNNSLQPGEELLAALGVAVRDKVKYMAAGYLGGAVGEVTAVKKLNEQNEADLSQKVPSIEKYPPGAVIIGLTPARLLIYKLNFLGRPKELGADYARNEVVKAEMENKKINYSLVLFFADGGKITHDVSLTQGDELKQFVGLINQHLSSVPTS